MEEMVDDGQATDYEMNQDMSNEERCPNKGRKSDNSYYIKKVCSCIHIAYIPTFTQNEECMMVPYGGMCFVSS